MITQQQLKDQTTPEFIKWFCEYAEGFRLLDDYTLYAFECFDCKISGVHESLCLFPLILHRAVEGWNKNNMVKGEIQILNNCIEFYTCGFDGMCFDRDYDFSDYQPSTLTPCEMAIWHCLIELFKEVGK